jgi:hypothetical protein
MTKRKSGVKINYLRSESPHFIEALNIRLGLIRG